MKIISKLLMLAIAVISISCDSDEEPEVVCDRYYLKEEEDIGGLRRYFYNGDGLLEVIEFEDATVKERTILSYDDDGLLIEATQGTFKIDFYYEDGLLQRCVSSGEYKFYYDEQSRLIKREWYWPAQEIQEYYTVEYPEAGVVRAQYYRRMKSGDLEPSYLYTMNIDDNPRPHPDEYYIFRSSTGGLFVPNHNVTILKTTENGVVKGLSAFVYEYNKGGYPVTSSRGVTYRYGCEP